MSGSRNDSRTIDEIDAASQGDVLPDFSFTWDGGDLANFAAFQSVDDAAFAYIRVSDEPD